MDAGSECSFDVREVTVQELPEEETFVVALTDEPDGDGRLLRFEITGTGFLRHMVRIIVGTLVDIGRGACQPGAFARAITSGERTELGMTAPPDGLYLDNIELDDWGYDEWPNHW